MASKKSTNTTPSQEKQKALPSKTVEALPASKSDDSNQRAELNSVRDSSYFVSPYTHNATPYTPSSAQAAEAVYDDDTGSGGVIVLLLLATMLVLFIIALISGSNSPTLNGTITGENTLRYGQKTTLTYTADEDVTLAEDDEIVWLIDGKEVKRTHHAEQDAYTLTLDSVSVGDRQVKVVAGDKFYGQSTINVAKPMLTVTIADRQYVYGSEQPKLNFSAQGFVEGDTISLLTANERARKGVVNNLSVGEHTSSASVTDSSGKYDVTVKQGKVTVLPKEIAITNPLTKEYDGTNLLKVDKLTLSGVCLGDEVTAKCDYLYMQDKNVGTKKVGTYNITLSGADAANYRICEELKATVTPKTVTVAGLTIKPKCYDGTNACEIEKVGRIQGVVSGDVLAIGEVKAVYDNEQVGQNKKITVQSIGLVGRDKANYKVTAFPAITADILPYEGALYPAD